MRYGLWGTDFLQQWSVARRTNSLGAALFCWPLDTDHCFLGELKSLYEAPYRDCGGNGRIGNIFRRLIAAVPYIAACFQFTEDRESAATLGFGEQRREFEQGYQDPPRTARCGSEPYDWGQRFGERRPGDASLGSPQG